MELGNSLCRVHRDTPRGPDFQCGLQFMESVARPNADAGVGREADERDCCATALGWLGSALSRISGRRADARACLVKAVELAPEDPYHLVALVELDLAAGGTDDHLALLALLLRQAAGYPALCLSWRARMPKPGLEGSLLCRCLRRFRIIRRLKEADEHLVP